MIKVNLGCGSTCLVDWINIDNSHNARLSKMPRLRYFLYKFGLISKDLYNVSWENLNIHIHDVKKRLPFSDNHVDYIYTSHLIEHLSKDEARNLLKDCYRVLKKGGRIRIVTPDLYLLSQNYLNSYKNNDIENQPADNFLIELGVLDDPESNDPWYVKYLYAKHLWLYDEKSLKVLMKSVGFEEIEKKDFKEGSVPDIDLLDNRPLTSLHIEAIKK